ncbi:MAG: hypothetical protein NC429_12630 [Lachnospiraceae bacterium]|nr:hypothetical protein [Lachnospiraceae bacterium]
MEIYFYVATLSLTKKHSSTRFENTSPSTAALFSEREWGDVEVILDTSGRFDNTPNQTKPEFKALSGDTDIENIEQWAGEQGIKEEEEIMVCELFDQYERKGEARGKIAGEDRFASLVQILMDAGRNDDLRRAATDREYREQLYMEAHIA